MPRRRHQNKDVEAAIKLLEDDGWRVVSRSGHPWGVARCGASRRGGCQVTIYSTPANPAAHARELRRAIQLCPPEHKTQEGS